MTHEPQNTQHAADLRHMAQGWHYLHAIHRLLRMARDGGEHSRAFALQAIDENAEALWRLHVHTAPPPMLRKRCGTEAGSLAASVHDLDPPATDYERRQLRDACRRLLALATTEEERR